MEDVRIVSGTLARYMSWGTGLSVSTGATSTFQDATTNPNATYKEGPYATFQGIVRGTGAVTATIVIEGSNEATSGKSVDNNWVVLGTITLAGTTTASDGFTTAAPWRFVRARVTAISGTGAAVQVLMGV